MNDEGASVRHSSQGSVRTTATGIATPHTEAANRIGTATVSATGALPLVHALQWADSAFPSGRFTLSNGVEGLIRDKICPSPATADELAAVLTELVTTTFVPTDLAGVLLAWNAPTTEHLVALDWQLSAVKPHQSVRQASQRVGTALHLMATQLGCASALMQAWWEADGRVGNAAIAAALIAKQCGLSAEEAAVQELYTFVASGASAAMRVGAVDFIAAQRAVSAVLSDATAFVSKAGEFTMESLGSYTPVLDITSAHHEYADERLFMT